MKSIFEIPRIDRGVIWGRAEAIARLSPHLTFSDVIGQAAREYESGRMGQSTVEDSLIAAVRYRPESLMKG